MIRQHHMPYRQYGGCLDQNQLSAMLVGRLLPHFAPHTACSAGQAGTVVGTELEHCQQAGVRQLH
jgi:hypothetical protein